MAVIEVQVPTSVLNQIGDFTQVDVGIFRGGNVTIPGSSCYYQSRLSKNNRNWMSDSYRDSSPPKCCLADLIDYQKSSNSHKPEAIVHASIAPM